MTNGRNVVANDLIAAHVLVMGRPPGAQFPG